MSQFKPSDFSLLLEVFREGLLRGLISREEVVAWADEIIKAEDEPDYFFIEISLAGNTNNLLEILGEYVVPSDSMIPPRVIFGLVCQKFTDKTINIEKAVDVLNNIISDSNITPFERGRIYSIDDHWDYMIYSGKNLGDVVLTNTTMKFVSYYRRFTLNNYNSWGGINQQVEKYLETAAVELAIENEIRMAGYAKQNNAKQRKNKIKKICLYLLICISAIAAIYVLLAASKVINGSSARSNFDEGLFSVAGLAIYAVLKIAYVLWRRVGVKRW
ncbi:MAG: hypothetical protein M3O71_13590 [Bacteroidota bacterium]|nr:hypothetical protein [Bacteroidota bacterium]